MSNLLPFYMALQSQKQLVYLDSPISVLEGDTGTYAQASVQMRADGTFYETNRTSSTYLFDWLIIGSASDYEVTMEVLSGAIYGNGPKGGTWEVMDETKTWYALDSNPNGIAVTATGILKIRAAGTVKVLATSDVTLRASVV